jgi:L-lactate dehydrogenase complex protein LldG
VVGETLNTAAREEVLARVRRGLADVPAGERPEDVPVPRDYLVREAGGTLQRFVERVADYGALVRVVDRDGVASAVAEACRTVGVRSLVVPADLPPTWVPDDVIEIPEAGLGARDLDSIGAALTGCALGIAETGTIVLDAGARQGRRVLTLVPDVHICVIDEEQLVDGVPAAMRRLADGMRRTRLPLTFVSGPSATSDIELARVEGVHGPRRLCVVVARAGV